MTDRKPTENFSARGGGHRKHDQPLRFRKKDGQLKVEGWNPPEIAEHDESVNPNPVDNDPTLRKADARGELLDHTIIHRPNVDTNGNKLPPKMSEE